MTTPKTSNRARYEPLCMNSSPEFAAQTRAAAAQESRSVSGFLKWLVAQHLKTKGTEQAKAS